MPDTDPNQVCLTGENSFIRLQLEENGTQMTRVSHWRILYSPGGPGHVLFMQSDVTDNAVVLFEIDSAPRVAFARKRRHRKDSSQIFN